MLEQLKTNNTFRNLLYKWAPSAFVICCGISLCILLVHVVKTNEKNSIEKRFNTISENTTLSIEHHLHQDLEALDWMGQLWQNGAQINRDDFAKIAANYYNLNSQCDEISDIRSLAWIPKVTHEQRLWHEIAAREDGIIDFEFTQSHEQGHLVNSAIRKEYFPVYFAEPYNKNKSLLGFDLASEKTSLEALRQATDSGEKIAASTRKFNDVSYGFWVLRPIYNKDASFNTVEDRRNNLKGFVAGLFDTDRVIKTALSHPELQGVDISIYDVSESNNSSFVAYYCSDTGKTAYSQAEYKKRTNSTELSHKATVNLAGRKWQFVYTPTEALVKSVKTWQSDALVFFGFGSIVMLTIYLVCALRRIAEQKQITTELVSDKDKLEKKLVEQKWTEKFLRQKEQYMESMFNAAPFEMLLLNENLHVEHANDIMEKLTSKNKFELLNNPIGEALGCIHADDDIKGCGHGPICSACPFRRTLTRVLESAEEVHNVEIQPTLVIDNTKKSPTFTISVEPTTINEHRYLIVTIQDITENLYDKRQLQEHIKYLNCLYKLSKLAEKPETALDTVFNQAVELIRQTYQFPEQTFVRATYDGIQYKTDDFKKSESSQFAQISIAGEKRGTIEVYYTGPEPENGQVFLEAESELLEAIGEQLASFAERKQSADQLRLFRLLIDKANDCFFVIEPKWGRLLDVNDRACHSLGYTREELLKMTVKDLNQSITDDKTWDKLTEQVQQEGFTVLEDMHTTKNGSVLPVEIDINFITLGSQSYLVAVSRDITERKKAEEKQAQLLQKVTNINKELKDFAYVVSHDLKAPLRGIKTLVDWITTDYGDKFDEDGKEQFTLLASRVQRMHDLINGVLQYSRVGHTNENLVRINLGELVPEIVDLLAAPENITITIEDELPEICCERTRISQVFQNLLSNAIKYMDKPEGYVKISCEQDGDCWKFGVSDNGPGIEEQHFEKIFRIFQTLTPKDQYESTGVGLTLVKKIVQLYGGKIWIESTVGEGTTFFFTLPKTLAQAPDSTEPERDEQSEQSDDDGAALVSIVKASDKTEEDNQDNLTGL